MIQNLDPRQAWQFLQDNPNAVLIDVRTEGEYRGIGHPIGAVHISWLDQFGGPVNPNFIHDVATFVPDISTPVLLLCRSGQRSLSAANTLEQVGYQHLINIVEGFEGVADANQKRGNINGWKFHGLPWQQG